MKVGPSQLKPSVVRTVRERGRDDLPSGLAGSMMATPDGERTEDWSWTLLACTAAFALSATAALVYVLREVVPYHATILEQMALNIPPSTFFAVAVSNRFVRLLPLLRLVTAPVGGVIVVLGLAAVAFLNVPILKVVRVAALGALALGLAMAGAAGFVLYALEQAYR